MLLCKEEGIKIPQERNACITYKRTITKLTVIKTEAILDLDEFDRFVGNIIQIQSKLQIQII